MSEEERHEEQGGTVNPIQVQKFLKGIDYPVDKQTILRTAEQQGADDMVMQSLNRLPDREFDGPNAISNALGDIR